MDRREERPEVEEQPAKCVFFPLLVSSKGRELMCRRVRADTQKEDRARGKRLFGNILGTLQKFQKEDKTSRKSEAVCLPLCTSLTLYPSSVELYGPD